MSEGLRGPKPILAYPYVRIFMRLAGNRLMNNFSFLVLMVKPKFSYADEKSSTTYCISGSLYAQKAQSSAYRTILTASIYLCRSLYTAGAEAGSLNAY